MDAPAIALRFRDTALGIDTIKVHREILDRDGKVWWGWWKKAFEDESRDLLSNLFLKKELTTLLLVDRSKKKMFEAKCATWTTDKSAVVPEGVPLYYRGHIDDVFGWFLLTSIEDAHFDPDIAQKFGDDTLVSLINGGGPVSTVVKIPGYKDRSSILHLSDLHFGKDYAYKKQDEQSPGWDSRKTLTSCVLEDLAGIGRQKDIAAVIVTGDFISRGNWNDEVRRQALNEFEALRGALDLRKDQIFVVPGNHDIVRYPDGEKINVTELAVEKQTTYNHEIFYRTFVEELIGRPWGEPLNYLCQISLKNADLLVCILNSCRIAPTQWTEYGYVGESGLSTISQMKNIPIERPTFKFMALHHHLLPVCDVEAPASRGVSLSLDASILLESAQQAGVHVALHGHQHMPKLSRYQNIPLMGGPDEQPLLVVSNGSAGAIRECLPGGERNTYCLFELLDNGINLWMHEIRPDGKKGARLYEGPLGVSSTPP